MDFSAVCHALSVFTILELYRVMMSCIASLLCKGKLKHREVIFPITLHCKLNVELETKRTSL